MNWTYVKLDEHGKRKSPPINDFDGTATGHIVFGVKNWLDENPEERKRLGWIKHIHHTRKEIKEIVGDWNPQTQNLITTLRQIDEYTIEDTYHVMDKSEEQILFEEMQSISDTWIYGDGVISWGPGEYIVEEDE